MLCLCPRTVYGSSVGRNLGSSFFENNFENFDIDIKNLWTESIISKLMSSREGLRTVFACCSKTWLSLIFRSDALACMCVFVVSVGKISRNVSHKQIGLLFKSQLEAVFW